MGGDGDALDQGKVKIVDACCCAYDGCLFGDGCYGCMGSSTTCCFESEFCCKMGQEKLCCICMACRCVAPTVCMKQQQQVCCCVSAISIPPDAEVPCMFSQCGINCYPNFGCLKTMDELTGKGGDGSGASPTAAEMQAPVIQSS